MFHSPLALALVLAIVLSGCLDLDEFAPQSDQKPPAGEDRKQAERDRELKEHSTPEKSIDRHEQAEASDGESEDTKKTPVHDYRPRVIIGIPDTGINPYHELFYRPDLTEHPSTYIEGYPETIPALNLSVGGDDYDEMFQADIEAWKNLREGQWFWIPQTVFIGVYCDRGQPDNYRGDYCILDHGEATSTNHGTGTVSSALMENPEALIAFKAGSSGIALLEYSNIPIDVFSVSWGSIVPIPGHPQVICSGPKNTDEILYVVSAGNDPRSTLIDCWKGKPSVISVGGAYAEDNNHQANAAHQTEVVSYFCRPMAASQTTKGMENRCGTSFSAPTVAGGLSKAILAIRNHTSYTGGIQGDYVDPVAGVTMNDLRDALNRTATYDPKAKYNNTGTFPTIPAAPWIQWGWGFYDGWVANETMRHFLEEPAAEKPDQAVTYMEALHMVKSTTHRNFPVDLWPFQQDDAGSGQNAPDSPVPEVWIESGIVYEGTLGGVLPYDGWDFYAFWGEKGHTVEARAHGVYGTFAIEDDARNRLESQMTLLGYDVMWNAGFSVTLERSGIHYFVYNGLLLHNYSFSIGINEPAPDPGHEGQPLPPVPSPIP